MHGLQHRVSPHSIKASKALRINTLTLAHVVEAIVQVKVYEGQVLALGLYLICQECKIEALDRSCTSHATVQPALYATDCCRYCIAWRSLRISSTLSSKQACEVPNWERDQISLDDRAAILAHVCA